MIDLRGSDPADRSDDGPAGPADGPAGPADGPRSSPGADGPATRSHLRSVALPAEHGGWGLTLEPVVLGLAVAASPAGGLLAAVAFLGFLARTPIKAVLVDLHRGRRTGRGTVARRVAVAEIAVLLVALTLAARLSDGPFWIPLAAAAPLVGVELWFDMRSRSRRLLPELAGSVGICAVVASMVLADGGDARLAVALWLVLAARAITSIPYVKAQVERIHGRPTERRVLVASAAAALLVGATAVAVDRSVFAGAVAVALVAVLQPLSTWRSVPRAAILGARQMVLGLTVVLITALGVLAP